MDSLDFLNSKKVEDRVSMELLGKLVGILLQKQLSLEEIVLVLALLVWDAIAGQRQFVLGDHFEEFIGYIFQGLFCWYFSIEYVDKVRGEILAKEGPPA